MTYKPIIIDGVDVSLCKKYEHEIVRCNATLKNMCFCGGRCTDKKNADCYFKQLKRSEAQCEAMFVLHTDLEKKYKAKERECEMLMKKDEINTFFNTPIDGWSSDPCEICKYEQTLIEIKEIVEKQVKRAPDGETFARPEIKQILQKISECEVENERKENCN